MELQKNAHQKFKGKKRNGSKTRAAIMESITSLLKRSLNRAWVYHYSRANLFITNKIRIFSLNEFFVGFHGGSNISSSASIFQTVKLSYKYRYLYSQSRSFYNQILFPQSRNPFKKKKTGNIKRFEWKLLHRVPRWKNKNKQVTGLSFDWILKLNLEDNSG